MCKCIFSLFGREYSLGHRDADIILSPSLTHDVRVSCHKDCEPAAAILASHYLLFTCGLPLAEVDIEAPVSHYSVKNELNSYSIILPLECLAPRELDCPFLGADIRLHGSLKEAFYIAKTDRLDDFDIGVLPELSVFRLDASIAVLEKREGELSYVLYSGGPARHSPLNATLMIFSLLRSSGEIKGGDEVRLIYRGGGEASLRAEGGRAVLILPKSEIYLK